MRVSQFSLLLGSALVIAGLTACAPASTPDQEANAGQESAAASPTAPPASVTPTPAPSESAPGQPDEATAPSAEAAAPSAEDSSGTWCPTPESLEQAPCLTITYPEVVTDGQTRTLSLVAEENGTFTFVRDQAPFGVYTPAGVPIEVPSYYPGQDLPDQDRIWNGQTGTMLVRN